MGVVNSLPESRTEEKDRLIILSDLWGKQRSDWVKYYTEPLNQQFDVQYYDCCELGSVDTSNYTEEALHHEFVQYGIDRAVARLTELEKGPVHILAFSVGGTIAWKFGLMTGNIQSLHAVSSTRLRYEDQKPDGHVKLYFGASDPFRPSEDWFNELSIEVQIISGQNHELYTNSQFASALIDKFHTII